MWASTFWCISCVLTVVLDSMAMLRVAAQRLLARVGPALEPCSVSGRFYHEKVSRLPARPASKALSMSSC